MVMTNLLALSARFIVMAKKKRQQAKIIMRYAGPRMLFNHPIMAIKHLIQKRRAVPDIKK